MEYAIPIFLGLMAGLIALYQVKLNIISNSRIKWIETLRETISEYCMEISNCNYLKINLYDENERLKGKKKTESETELFLDKFYLPYAESAKRVEKLSAKIMLYLNPNNEKHLNIEELMAKNGELIKKIEIDNRHDLGININEIITRSRVIFRIEWKKSKGILKR